jgi:hypothetical protein
MLGFGEKKVENNVQNGEQNDGRIIRVIHEGKLSIYPDGVFETEDGKTKEYKKGIKLTVSGRDLKVSARFLAALYFVLHDDEEVRAEIRVRLKEEQQNERVF